MKRSKKAGLSPGTLVHVGEKKQDQALISYIDYDEKKFEEKKVSKIEDCFPLKDTSTVSWINIDGLHDTKLIDKLGQQFKLHSLLLEDVVNTAQRPKYEEFENEIFMVLKMIFYNGSGKINFEQVSIILGKNFVISFQEKSGDVFDSVRERLRSAKGRLKTAGPDYLAYALVDALVDSYFSILERLGEEVDSLEEELLDNPTPATMERIHKFKRDAMYLRKAVWPLREVISGFARSESKLINEQTKIFIRDIYDHTIQVIDTIETFRDILSGMLDMYLSSLSNKMNEVMKVLTIFAAIFIPLTFIAGVYGMNFDLMPELRWRFGYFGVWGIMLAVAITMLFFFNRRKWL
jgi:magnesium transporter